MSVQRGAEGEELTADSEISSAKERALRILARRPLSSREVEKRLVSKGETADAARRTVEWLEYMGLINDTEYAAMIVSHYRAGGYGIGRIKDELYRRGIARDMWDDALSIPDETGAEDAALKFIEKKLKGSTDKADLRRAADALVRRGFSYDDARAAIDKYLESETVGL